MSPHVLALALALVGWTLVGCEKDPASGGSPEQPDGVKVIVEQPGDAPSSAGAEAPEPDDSGAEPSTGRTEIVTTDIPCKADADCVAATCCHADSCVAAADAPNCAAVSCTADCQAGTMDCNGGCLCQDGKCAARLWWAPGG